MVENTPTDLPKLPPLANGESRTIPQMQHVYGAYGLELWRDNKFASVSFISETQAPLDRIWGIIQDPPEDIKQRDDWRAVGIGVANIGRIYEPGRDIHAESEQYKMTVRSNSYALVDFRKYVLEPMERVGLIPETVLWAFS